MTRTSSERLADIGAAAERVSRAVEAMERAEADGSEDGAQRAFDALLYRLVAEERLSAVPAFGTENVSAG